jgi:hypothetical protein
MLGLSPGGLVGIDAYQQRALGLRGGLRCAENGQQNEKSG